MKSWIISQKWAVNLYYFHKVSENTISNQKQNYVELSRGKS